MGYSFVVPSTTNQQFPILPNELIEKLGEKWGYSFWGKIDEQHSAVRFCTSWASDEAAVEQLCRDICGL